MPKSFIQNRQLMADIFVQTAQRKAVSKEFLTTYRLTHKKKACKGGVDALPYTIVHPLCG
jgi:hypothetical protein